MQQHKSLRNDINLSLEGKGRRGRGWKISIWSIKTTALSVMFSIEAEVRTRQDVNLRIRVFWACDRAGCVDPFFTSENLSLSQSSSKPELPSLCVCLFCGDTIFFKTQGSHILGSMSSSCSVKRGSPADKQHKASAGPLQVLCVSGKTFLISNVCSNGAHVHLVKPHKALHFGHKRKEPCLNNSISFAFSPLVMTFIIYSLFWNCFQAFFFFRIFEEHFWWQNQT